MPGGRGLFRILRPEAAHKGELRFARENAGKNEQEAR